MKRQNIKLVFMLAILLAGLHSHAQQAIAQPYYGDGVIRFYNKSSPVGSSPCYTLDLSADINTNWGTTSGINDVVIYQGKLFVSIDNGSNEGGVLVYDYADVYPTKTGGPVSVINPQNTHGLPVAGIVIQPSTGNLYVGTFYTGASDAGIYLYTASSGYSNSAGTQFASYYNDASVDQYIADLAFDASGNLWFTEFDGTNVGTGTAYEDHFLICYKAANKTNYYKIINPSTQIYPSTSRTGGAGPSTYLLSQPEGLTFDASGNLWLGNNNDNFACNTAGDGTLVKISASWITGTLFSQTYGTSITVPTANATVDYISGGKLGGLLMDGNNLYVNDQGQNQGASYTSNGTVWKWNTTTTFNSTNFAASGIHTTYPGNGLMALDNPAFSVASDCYPSAEKNILTFTIPTQVGGSTIDTTTATVAVLMPYTANLASLTPTITVSPSATINPLSGVAESFTTPHTYVVTAQDHSTKSWTVTVTKQAAPSSGEKNILTFTIPTQVGVSTIDTTTATVAVLMPSGANLASLTPTITVSPSATISPLSGVAESFTVPHTYIVTAQNATTKSWTVTVTKQSALSDAKNILTFAIPSQVGSAVIDTVHATVAVVMPSGTNLSSLTPAITVSTGASINPHTGVAENFSAPYSYVVTAADATTQTWTVTVTQQAPSGGGGAAQARAATLGKGMNLSIWLESSYWFFNTTTYPDVTRFTESDIEALHSLCFNTIRLPVFFEPFANMTAPYAFDMTNQNVVRGLAYVDSVIAWTAAAGMDLVIDNHLSDDVSTDNLQANYQITDANYASRAALIAGVWRQAVQRYGYADPNRVFFELRNEPNTVSDANLRTVYQTVIDTVRKYDQTHTLIVGCSGYYDPIELSSSTPYSDTNLIYTFHIYNGDLSAYPGFCFQGQGGLPATDTLSGPHVSFALNGAQAADITSEVQGVQTWSAHNGVPVWLGEFGCSTLADVYHDDTSRCNYIRNMSEALSVASTPWAYWDGYGPEGVYISYDGGTTLTYTFSMFDATNILSASHLDACFAADLALGSSCTTGITNAGGTDREISLYPNPANDRIFVAAPGAVTIKIYDVVGQLMQQPAAGGETTEIITAVFPTGVYIARVQFADGTYAVKKFVKE